MADGDGKRQPERYPVSRQVEATSPGGRLDGELVDSSAGGAAIVATGSAGHCQRLRCGAR